MSVAQKIRAAIFISGRGSNMNTLIEAAKAPDYPVEIGVVISNVKEAAGLKLAKAAGIKTAVVEHKTYGGDRTAFEQALQSELKKHDVALICLAGFMRVLTPAFLKEWPRRIINIHPSLLPHYRGLDTHQRVLDAKETMHGCSVHYVSDEVDAGEVVAQIRVPVLPDDTEESLSARVLQAEHKLYPKALCLVAERMHDPLLSKKHA